MSSRSYDASSRRSAAAANRTRVVEAATELLLARGYAATTVAEVAAAAGVSVPFVYAAFGNKVGLLKKVFDVAIAGDDEPVAVRDRADAVAAMAARTARRRCQLTAELIARITTRTAPLVDVVRQAAGADAEVAEMLAEGQDGRRSGMGEFVAFLDHDGQLRPGLDAERATDIVWCLSDPVIYQQLRVQRGWSHDEYTAWLGQAIYDGICARRGARER